jgi:hypothetical protein
LLKGEQTERHVAMQLKYHLEKRLVILNRGTQALAHLWLSKLKEPVKPHFCVMAAATQLPSTLPAGE